MTPGEASADCPVAKAGVSDSEPPSVASSTLSSPLKLQRRRRHTFVLSRCRPLVVTGRGLRPSSDASGGTTNESDYSDIGDMEWFSEHFPDLAATEREPRPPPVAALAPPAAAAARPPSPPPPPPPFLDVPPVTIQRLVAITADAVVRHPAARVDMVEDAVVQEVALHAALPQPQEQQPQERAVRLAVGFGVGLLGSLSRRLLDSVAARYAGDALTPQHVLAMFMAEELELWSRRAPTDDTA